MGERYPVHYWHRTADGRIHCDVCPRDANCAKNSGGLLGAHADSDEMALTT